MTLESTIEAYLVKRVEALGGICLKGDVKGRRFIDRICILPGGVTIYVETKRPKGGRRSKHQEATIKTLQDMGHEAGFAYTKFDIECLLARYVQGRR